MKKSFLDEPWIVTSGSSVTAWLQEAVLRRLKEEKKYGIEFAGKMKASSNCFLNQNGMITINVASPLALKAMEETAGKVLGRLPFFPVEFWDYGL